MSTVTATPAAKPVLKGPTVRVILKDPGSARSIDPALERELSSFRGNARPMPWLAELRMAIEKAAKACKEGVITLALVRQCGYKH